jgi:hypothetical protein
LTVTPLPTATATVANTASQRALEGHMILQTAAKREMAESLARVHERLGEVEKREVVAHHVTEIHNDNRQSLVAHLTQAHFSPTLVHNTLNSYTMNSMRENSFHVHVDPTGHVSAPAASSSSGPMHPAATRQLADEVEIHGAGKRTKKELKELADMVPMSIEDKKRAIEDAAVPNKKPRAAKPIEDRPTPSIEDKKPRARSASITPAIEDRPASRAASVPAPAAKRAKAAIEDRVPAAAVAAKRAKSVSISIEDAPKRAPRNAKAVPEDALVHTNQKKTRSTSEPAKEKRVPKGKGRGTTVVKTVSKNAYPFALVAA